MNHAVATCGIALLLGTSSLVACGAKADAAAAGSSAILGGTTARDHEEVVLVQYTRNSRSYLCSGAVVAPRVVLTAGHCVDGATSFRVTAPYANNQDVTGSGGATYDYRGNRGDGVNARQHDVGLVFLDQPVALSSYPTLADEPVDDGALAQNIGRVDDGVLSRTDLFAGPAIPLRFGAVSGFLYDYTSTAITQPGDSGGPVELVGTRTIVGTCSGGGDGFEVMARVDLVSSWIRLQIQSHGGTTPVLAQPPSSAPTTPTTPTTPAVPAASQVTIYADPYYGGASRSFGVGRYTAADLGAVGDDAVSSMRVPDDLRLTIYADDGFGGRSGVVLGDVPWIGANWNDVEAR